MSDETRDAPHPEAKRTDEEADKKPYRYPLKRVHWRFPDPDYTGDMFVWDIDNTYLRTNFSSWAGLMRIPFESAEDKVNVGGTSALLKELRHGAGAANEKCPIYFISASPPQLAKVIEEKMALDGFEHDGIVFKDQMANIRRGHFRKLREQYGFKLSALLANRKRFPLRAREYLFGDDSESDASIYSLYADIAGGRLRGASLVATLANLGVGEEDVAHIAALAEELPEYDPVQKIFIHLEKKTPHDQFAIFGSDLIATYDSFELALALYAEDKIRLNGMMRVGTELLQDFGFTDLDLLKSFFRCHRHGILNTRQMVKLTPTLRTAEILPAEFAFEPLKGWEKRLKDAEAARATAQPDRFRTPEKFLTIAG
ncbi:MAG: hypothetical protein KC466_06470 [Myxococcales bacterium]|nr:hypothetical protein [Myxococcales bacterium]